MPHDQEVQVVDLAGWALSSLDRSWSAPPGCFSEPPEGCQGDCLVQGHQVVHHHDVAALRHDFGVGHHRYFQLWTSFLPADEELDAVHHLLLHAVRDPGG